MTLNAKRIMRSIAFIASVAVAFVACGDDDGGTSSGSTGSSSTFSCCINGNGYDCPSSEALSDCGNGDPSACSADSSACSTDSDVDVEIEEASQG